MRKNVYIYKYENTHVCIYTVNKYIYICISEYCICMYISRELDSIKPNYCFQNPNMKNNKAIQGKHDGDSSMVIVVVVVVVVAAGVVVVVVVVGGVVVGSSSSSSSRRRRRRSSSSSSSR